MDVLLWGNNREALTALSALRVTQQIWGEKSVALSTGASSDAVWQKMLDPRGSLPRVHVKISFPVVILMLMHLRCSGIINEKKKKSFPDADMRHECWVTGDGKSHTGVNVFLLEQFITPLNIQHGPHLTQLWSFAFPIDWKPHRRNF